VSDPVALALIGAGRMGRTHLGALAGSDTVRIRSVVDPSAECRAAAKSIDHGVDVILVLIYLYFPFAALTLYATLERFDWQQLRAAMDLGAPPRVALTRVLLPQIRPGVTTAVIFVFIPVLGEYLTPQLVGGTRGVMIGNLIVNFFQGAEYTRGAAVSLLIAALIVALLAAFRKQLAVAEAYGR
jgi:ABC-type spermidine/putrescine transport system permease subunit I